MTTTRHRARAHHRAGVAHRRRRPCSPSWTRPTVHSSDAHGATMSAQAEKVLRGQRLVVQLAEDGSVESARDARGAAVPRDVADAMAAMPAVLPRRPVAVGERWQREMPLPSAGPLGAGGTRRSAPSSGSTRCVRARRGRLRLDARTRSSPTPTRAGSRCRGACPGAMQIDRARGWMTDSFFTSAHPLPRHAAGGDRGCSPMKFVTRVTQRLRTMDKR